MVQPNYNPKHYWVVQPNYNPKHDRIQLDYTIYSELVNVAQAN